MILRIFTGLMAVSALSTTALAANDQAPKPKKEPKICRAERVTGTRMVPQVCKTAAEWAEIARQSSEVPDRTLQTTSTTQSKSESQVSSAPF